MLESFQIHRLQLEDQHVRTGGFGQPSLANGVFPIMQGYFVGQELSPAAVEIGVLSLGLHPYRNLRQK